MTFYLDGVAIGSAALVAGEGMPRAWLTTPALSAGTHEITAVYSGDAFYAATTMTGWFDAY